MSEHLSYIVETNGENGVRIEWRLTLHVPESVVWEHDVNSFTSLSDFPEADLASAPEYARNENGGAYEYYRRTIVLPSKMSSFLLSVLIDGAENNGGYFYEPFAPFLSITKEANLLNIYSTTNVSKLIREGSISITSNQYGEILEVFIVQEFIPIQINLVSYVSNGVDGFDSGGINAQVFEHTFYWLTNINSPKSETIDIQVEAIGPRNGFILRSVEKFVYDGEISDRYTYSSIDNKYYETLQRCVNGGFETVREEVIYDSETENVYKKVTYNDDLKIIVTYSGITITNYGRCFLQPDAYYVVTLSNVDNLNVKSTIKILYKNEET